MRKMINEKENIQKNDVSQNMDQELKSNVYNQDEIIENMNNKEELKNQKDKKF